MQAEKLSEDHLQNIINKHKDRLCQKKNVVGVGAGERIKNGEPTGEPAILIFVIEKESEKCLNKKDIVDKEIDGVKTDVVGKIGKIQAQYEQGPVIISAQGVHNMRLRPAPAGVSIGHIYVSAGTLGAFFVDRDKDVVILSNQHVMAGEQVNGPHGPAPRKGNVIVQPGKHDGGNLNLVIAHLKDWVPLRSKGNLQDSAIAHVKNLSLIQNSMRGLGKVNGIANIKVGQQVQKVGRSTGHTTGKVISTRANVCVEYGKFTRCFNDCIITTAMSQGGDSGSALLDMKKNIVGLLFAGSDNVTIYNPINYPIKTYGLSLWKK